MGSMSQSDRFQGQGRERQLTANVAEFELMDREWTVPFKSLITAQSVSGYAK